MVAAAAAGFAFWAVASVVGGGANVMVVACGGPGGPGREPVLLSELRGWC